jgi:membrane-bound serine protease (ClpP class)
MKKFLIIILFFSYAFYAQSSSVYLISIKGEINPGLVPYVERGIKEAEENNARAIIFEINTFGGRVDAATEIKDLILNAEIPTVAFVNKRAISAGSLIALSSKKIVMAPGSSIGATTVVDEKGKKQSEKYQSYMRSEMRATAEKNGRPKKIAEAMVDERVVVPGLVDSTRLVTLTAEEAVRYGIADTILADVHEVAEFIGLPDAEIVNVSENAGEKVVRFLNNPIITSLLIMIGMVGMFVEIKTPGWGIAGTLSIIAFILFFGSGFILNLVSALDVAVFVIGVILLLLEIFVIPGFGITGVLGILAIISSLFLGLLPKFDFITPENIEIALWQLAASLVLSVIFTYFLFKFLPKTRIWNNFILKEKIRSNSGYDGTIEDKKNEPLLGKEGIALSDLRPSGIALIDELRVDVVTQGEYVDKGNKIKVIAKDGIRIIVKKI